MALKDFLEVAVIGLSFGAAFALLALSINVIYSSSNILNFAQGELMMLGGMLGWSLYSVANLPYLVVFLLIALIMGIIGAIEYYVIVWPLMRRGASLISIIIGTLGFSIVVRIATALTMGRVERFAKPPLEQEGITLLGAAVQPQSLLVLGIVVAALIVISWIYLRTTLGMALRATAFEPDGARIMGVNVSGVMAATFAAGGALAGIAGFIVSPLSYASPWIGLDFSIEGFAAAIIGGLGSWPGAVIGGVVLGVGRSLMLRYVSPSWGSTLIFVVILLVLYIRPTGLIGEWRAAGRGSH